MVLVVAALAWYQDGPLPATFVLVFFALTAAITIFGLRRTRTLLSQLRWMLPVLVFMGTSVGFGFVERDGSERFYELAAQVIPVLLLGVSLEGSLIARPSVRDTFEFGMALLTLIGLGWGEFEALRAVELGHGSEGTFGTVVAALFAGFVAIITLGLLEPDDDDDD
jgi:hypothetical protein